MRFPDLNRTAPTDLPEIYRSVWADSISIADEPSLLTKLPYERISLERRASMTVAPDYRVVLHRSGLAELDDKGGPLAGRFTSDIDPYNCARLCYLIEHSRFESLPPDYGVDGSDSETVIVSVTDSSREHTLSEYGLVDSIDYYGESSSEAIGSGFTGFFRTRSM